MIWPLDMWDEPIEIPDWLERFAIARSLNCKPWELDDVPTLWQKWAIAEMHIREKLTYLNDKSGSETAPA